MLSVAEILQKAGRKIRISEEEALYLFENAEPGQLGVVAHQIKTGLVGNKVFFNRNIHIEPTNICINQCKFCFYAKKHGDAGSFCLSLDEICLIIEENISKKITEVHIVGGVYPGYGLEYYTRMISVIHNTFPHLHIKAFTAEELNYMFSVSKVNIAEGLAQLKKAGLNSLPGGGAEIFSDDIRTKLCPEKIKAEKWLEIHRMAHLLGIPSNATMLYGHIETLRHRVKHMAEIRKLQDETHGFNAFIPLKFNTSVTLSMSINEITLIDELKTVAISRIFLDNIPHIKAYWPSCGIDTARIALSFGADDIDGTLYTSTKIYDVNGNIQASEEYLKSVIKNAGFIPVERDSEYRKII